VSSKSFEPASSVLCVQVILWLVACTRSRTQVRQSCQGPDLSSRKHKNVWLARLPDASRSSMVLLLYPDAAVVDCLLPATKWNPKQGKALESTCCDNQTAAPAVQLRGAPAESVAEVK